METRGRKKGTPKTGGRQKGSKNKITNAVKECLSSLITEYANSETFAMDFASLEPKDRLLIAEKFLSYIVPKMQSVAIDDKNKETNKTIEMLISLRDGQNQTIPNFEDEEDGEE
jgi:hypothetical protein